MQIVIVLAIVAAVAARPDEGFYDSKYDNINVDELIENDRLFKSYSHCFLDIGKCTAEANDLKILLPEAIQSSCGKCTKKQKTMVAKVIKTTIEKLPEEWKQLSNKYNPDGKHTEELNQYLQTYAPK